MNVLWQFSSIVIFITRSIVSVVAFWDTGQSSVSLSLGVRVYVLVIRLIHIIIIVNVIIVVRFTFIIFVAIINLRLWLFWVTFMEVKIFLGGWLDARTHFQFCCRWWLWLVIHLVNFSFSIPQLTFFSLERSQSWFSSFCLSSIWIMSNRHSKIHKPLQIEDQAAYYGT